MKIVGVVGVFVFVSVAAFIDGRIIGYREGFHDGSHLLQTQSSLQSHCYTPDDVAKGMDVSGMPQCVTLEEQ